MSAGRPRRLPWLAVLVLLVLGVQRFLASEGPAATPAADPAAAVAADTGPASDFTALHARRAQDVQVRGHGEVVRLLPDDDEGSRHQRFILRTADGHTLLVAHNIDLAPRLEHLARGDVVRFNGEYAWNERGGVVHWTHRDPAGRHDDGWLQHRGRTYQ